MLIKIIVSNKQKLEKYKYVLANEKKMSNFIIDKIEIYSDEESSEEIYSDDSYNEDSDE